MPLTGRIEAARAARRCPSIVDLLADGSITLTPVTLLGPHLTPENHREVLTSALHKNKREVEEIVARLRPQPPVAAVVRKLPSPKLIDTPVLGSDGAADSIPTSRPEVPAP